MITTSHISDRLRSRMLPIPSSRAVAAGTLLLLLGASAAWSPRLRAQEADAGEPGEGLTVERIFGSEDLRPESFSASWKDGGSWLTVEADDEGRGELWEIRAEDGERTRAISADELVPEGDSASLAIDGFQLGPDGRRVLIFTDAQRVWRARTKGKYYVFDLTTRELRPVSEAPGWQMFAKFSPDGTRVAFVREHDLFVTDLETWRERAITTTGSADTINGTTDWVYEEELGLRDAFRWSPDGRRIAYWQLDQSPIPPFHLVDETTLYPTLQPVRYPKAGTENSRVRVGVLELAATERSGPEGRGTEDPGRDGETTWFAVGNPEYVARMEWVDPETVAIQTLNRHQNRLELRLGDPETGETRTVHAETDSAWVDVDDDLTWLEDGRRFVWSDFRDGWHHLWLRDRDGGEARLTAGEWDVTAFHGVDEERGRVWFTAAHPTPYTRSVGYVTLAGEGPTWVAGPATGEVEGGVHAAEFAPDHGLFFDTRSTAASPPVTVLRRSDGRVVRTLEDNAELAARLDSLGIRSPDFIRVTAADGETPLNGWMIRPPGFDETDLHPLLLYVYGGPGVQTVMDGWGGTRGLWHQLMAQRGFVVASVDNRGTGARGRDFYRQTYLRLGQMETADQLAAVRQLSGRPGIDRDRTGLWGWSYGGYMTLLATLLSEGEIEAAVSVAPVTHWKLYDTVYTERYMRTPSENPEGYRKGAPLEYADRLESELLIVHGTGDDNVHPQNTVRMVRALEEANEQFRMRIYPNKRHGIAGSTTRVNLFGLVTDFFAEELGAR